MIVDAEEVKNQGRALHSSNLNWEQNVQAVGYCPD
jgi:hypothetical protein